MNTFNLRLTFDVSISPNGTPKHELMLGVEQIVKDALGNGTITGENSPAVIESWSLEVAEHNSMIRR